MTIDASNSKRAEFSIAVLKTQPCDERVAHALQLFSSMLWAFKGTTVASWKTTTPDDADVVVLHRQDRNNACDHWRARGKLIVEIASGEAASPGPYALTYPFRAEHVRSLLERLEARLRDADTRGNSVDEVTQSQSAFASGEEWQFVESMRGMRSRENKRRWVVGRDGAVSLVHLQWNATSYFADPGIAAAIRAGELNLNALRFDEGEPPAGGSRLRSGHELLWFAAYHASDRMVSSLAGATRIKLRRWPNVAAIRPEPFQLRITAALAGGEPSVDRLSERASVSQKEVIRTLNALAAADLVAVSESAPQPELRGWRPESVPRRGFAALLRDVRRHLGLGSST